MATSKETLIKRIYHAETLIVLSCVSRRPRHNLKAIGQLGQLVDARRSVSSQPAFSGPQEQNLPWLSPGLALAHDPVSCSDFRLVVAARNGLAHTAVHVPEVTPFLVRSLFTLRATACIGSKAVEASTVLGLELLLLEGTDLLGEAGDLRRRLPIAPMTRMLG